jgi:type I restriction enzyme S subunit
MKGKFWANNHVHILMGKRSVLNNLFLMYSINFQDISYYISGSTREKLNQQLLKSVYILFPSSLSEQRKIAEILETVDNAIGRTDTIIEKYKRIKQGLMQDLLTRGVVENDELGVMSYELRDEKKYKFKDSPLGRIPEEWKVVELNNGLIDDIYRYPTFYNIKFLNEGIGVLKVENISEDGLINQKLSEINYISKETNDRFPKTILKENDLIMAVRGATIGKIALVTKHFVGFNINPNLIKISVNQEKLEPKYFWTYMNSHIGKNIFESKVSSTAKQTITVPQFLSIEALLPSLLEQRKIAEILYQIDETIEKEQKYKQKLERIKQGLMEDLLTGKVRVNHLIKEGMKNVQPA